MTTFTITTGAQGLKFLDRDGVTVARIINRAGKGRWFATPASYVDGVLVNTDVAVQVDVTRLQHGDAKLIADALGL